jgi:hypothetical protein
MSKINPGYAIFNDHRFDRLVQHHSQLHDHDYRHDVHPACDQQVCGSVCPARYFFAPQVA